MSKKTITKAITVILSFIFIISLIPCSAFAESILINDKFESASLRSGISGGCGSNSGIIIGGSGTISGSSHSLTGDGTEISPYLIYDADDLILFRDKVNSGDTEISVKLMDDIVLNQNFNQSKFDVDTNGNVTYDGGDIPDTFTQWEPIGSSYVNNLMYNGTFDGNGYTIKRSVHKRF